MKSVIEINNLTKIYDNKKVINDLSFDIPEYSICGFLGPNGSGKTTTFKLLTGLIKNNGGSIKILDEAISLDNHSKYLRYLQDVPEFYNYMSTYEYLKFICHLNNLDNIDSLIDEVLELVGLINVKKKRIDTFSRGMKQRLGIASNIIAKPKILLLDEPISALDPIGRKEIFTLLNKLKGKMTILFSTHIIDDIEKVCDRIIVINNGKKLIDGKLQDIKNNYFTNFIEIVFIRKKDLNIFISNAKFKYTINDLTLKIEESANIQDNIFKILSDNKINISKFNVFTPSLEDIFIKEVLK